MTEERDPLDLLKNLAGGVDPEKCSPFQAMAREFALEAIAAWEKERALALDAIKEAAESWGAHNAALEKIEGEIIVKACARCEQRWPEVDPSHPYCAEHLKLADALRALRTGEGIAVRALVESASKKEDGTG